MAELSGTNLAGSIVPFTTEDTFATHLAKFGKGGWRSVADTAERDGITADRREAGMAVYVVAEKKLYILADDLTSWTELDTDSGYTKDEINGLLAAIEAQIDANADAIQKTREDYIQADSDIMTIINAHAEQITTNKNDIDDLGDQVAEIETKIPETASAENPLVTRSEISSVYKFKGSVATYNDLPTGATVGDVYNVIDTGANYAWDGSAWDKLSETVDLSSYATTAYVNAREQDIRADMNQSDSELQSQITAQAAAIAALDSEKLDKNQGSINAGKVLTVGEDGLVVPTDSGTGGGLQAVSHDNTLSGAGTDDSPLGLSEAIKDEISNKLDKEYASDFRGEWSNYASVPSDSNAYPADTLGSHIPNFNDYIIVKDSSDYFVASSKNLLEADVVGAVIQSTPTAKFIVNYDVWYLGVAYNGYMGSNVPLATFQSGVGTISFISNSADSYGVCRFVRLNPNTTYTISAKNGGKCAIASLTDEGGGYSKFSTYIKTPTSLPITFTTNDNSTYGILLYANSNGTECTFEEIQLEIGSVATSYEASGGYYLEGTWRFKYAGAWDTNNKTGWTPEYRLAGAGGGSAEYPDQTDNAGKFLMTDGANVSWQPTIRNNTEITNALAIGNNATANGEDAVVIGSGALSNSPQGANVVIGPNSRVEGYSFNSTAIGIGARATNYDALAVGRNSIAGAQYSTVVGYNSQTNTDYVDISDATDYNPILALGMSAYSRSNSTVAIGKNVYADGPYSIVMGYKSKVDQGCGNGIAIGQSAIVDSNSNYGISIGYNVKVKNSWSIAIGYNTQALSHDQVVIGPNAAAAKRYSVAIGHNATATGEESVQFGQGENTQDLTLQFREYTLVKQDGTIPPERLSPEPPAEGFTLVYDGQAGALRWAKSGGGDETAGTEVIIRRWN